MVCGVFQFAALDTPAPAVLVHAPWFVLFYRHRNLMFFRVIDLPVAGEVEFADRCNNFEPCPADNEIEPELVVSFPRAAMADRGCALLPGYLHDFFCNEGSG